MQPDYSITRDPLFLATVGLFAVLTTTLPTLLSQSWLLPILQTIVLTVFLSFAIRQRLTGQALRIVAIWLVCQLVVMILLSMFMPEQVERAIPDGFNRKAAFFEWFFTGVSHLDSPLRRPWQTIFELIGITIGTLATGGLIGIWILERTVNIAGFYAGSILSINNTPLGLVAGLPIWTIARILSYTGFAILLAEPMQTGNWSLIYYLTEHRRLLTTSIGLLLISLLLELVLSGLWHTTFSF
ncbi:hypothetical protein KFU94_58660 [Chloroflexi bacterium TSY]|nr:hypothetical protein [Chloroflexi bacterium TSY]